MQTEAEAERAVALVGQQWQRVGSCSRFLRLQQVTTDGLEPPSNTSALLVLLLLGVRVRTGPSAICVAAESRQQLSLCRPLPLLHPL